MRRRVVLVALPLLLGLLGSGCSTLRVAGTVAVKGSVPHTILVLEADDGREYALVGPLAGQIGREYQGRAIRVQGRVVKQSPAPGMAAELEITRVLAVLDP